MTSEVMIMNRQAVVLAADSAVTYGGGPDPVVTLEAEKILPLTRQIALMVYSRGDVLGRSWSHIAHAFSQAHGEDAFDTVEACAEAFFAFIDNNRRLFPEKEEHEEFEALMRAAYLTVLNYARALRTYPNTPYRDDADAFDAALDVYRGHLSSDEAGEPRATLDIYDDLTRERFNALYAEVLDRVLGEALGEISIADGPLRDKLFDLAYLLATRPAFLEPFAGLVFTGFGTEDVFPVYHHWYASILVDGIMKRAADEQVAVGVDDGPNAFVRTFAQADMTHAFLRGVHPTLFDLMISLNWVANEASARAALSAAGVQPAKAEEAMRQIEAEALPGLTRDFIVTAQAYSQEEFIDPFIAVVSASGKKQMGETAKALVELNILKADLQMKKNGVGGDVDVAMITRTAGLEWYQKKS